MRILLTADLHCVAKWHHWFLHEAPECDVLLVAGDLLNLFAQAGFPQQTQEVLKWRDDVLASGKAFAWSSGNHDYFRGESTPTKDGSPRWMKETPSHAYFVSDGESRLLKTAAGHLAVTTVPWPVMAPTLLIDGYRVNTLDFVNRLLREGQKIRETENVPWIVLCHEPPGNTPLSVGSSADQSGVVRQLIEAAQPDFSLHGHIHEAPIRETGSWICEIGSTACFNAGQSMPGKPVHHIFLKWRERGDWTAVWNGGWRTGRAESSQRPS